MEIKEQLIKNKFQFKHKFGQNFITDINLLKAIVNDANIQEKDNVLEIGSGAGTLTKQIAEATKGQVITVEIDEQLKPILSENLSSYNNIKIEFADILKVKPEIMKEWFDNQPFKVVANLPYYISTPILFYLLENEFNIQSITIMLQQEVAERLGAKPNTKDYGALSILLELLGKVTVTRKVPRTMFTPQPNVDSAIAHIELQKNKYNVLYKEIAPFIKSSFMMRRKTLENNIVKAYSITREQFRDICVKCNIQNNVRAESLTCQQFVDLFEQIKEYL